MAKSEEQREKAPRIISIFWVLSVLLVMLVVVPLVSYSWKIISSSKSYIEESLRERQLKTAIPAATHIQTLMDEYGRHLRDIAAAFEVFSNEPDTKQKYEDLLQRGILSRYLYKNTLLLAYEDREGGQFTAPWKGLQPEEQGKLARISSKVAGDALASGQMVRSPVFEVKLAALKGIPEPAIAMALPIESGSRSVSAVSAVFLLQSVQDSLSEYAREFTLFVTDTKGRLIFHSRAAQQGKNTDMSKDPIVNRVLASGVMPSGAINYNVTTVKNGKKTTFLVTSTPIQAYNWLLFAKVNRAKYYASIVQMKKQSTLWVVLSILAALLIGLVFARFITKPLSTLAEVSRKLARGELSQRADVRSKSEIGELARAFNAMADEIQRYIGKVEASAEETKQLFMDSIRAIANALDAKDPYTRGHSERVSAYSMVIGKTYGLDARMMRIIEISSLLHDVGKIGIADRILRKPGTLTPNEFAIMKTHPPKGAQILGSIPQMREIIPGIQYHHERWSGGGYPDGLMGKQIPLIARIIGVADAYDAMTTDRPYQKAMTPLQAANRINELKTIVYQPAIVEAFNVAFRKGLFRSFHEAVAKAKAAKSGAARAKTSEAKPATAGPPRREGTPPKTSTGPG